MSSITTLTGTNFDRNWRQCDRVLVANSWALCTSVRSHAAATYFPLQHDNDLSVDEAERILLASSLLADNTLGDVLCPLQEMLKVPDFTSHSQQLCFGGRKLHEHVLDHATQLLQQQTQSQFMLVSLQEAHQEVAGEPSLDRITTLDTELASFLAKVTQTDKDVMLLLASHRGLHATKAGTSAERSIDSNLAMEELLPALFLLSPQEVLQRHPQLQAVLKANQNAVVTAFDLHATLAELSTFPSVPTTPKGHGTSLLTPLSLRRTCREANIAAADCPCLER